MSPAALALVAVTATAPTPMTLDDILHEAMVEPTEEARIRDLADLAATAPSAAEQECVLLLAKLEGHIARVDGVPVRHVSGVQRSTSPRIAE